MRKVNSVSEFSSERSELLLNHFRKSIATQSVISASRAFHEAAEAPAPRFWVSEARAVRVINRMAKGDDPTVDMFPEKRDMYKEIFRRVMEIKRAHPEMTLGDIVFTVVNSEAPKSYISDVRAAQIIMAARRNNRRRAI